MSNFYRVILLSLRYRFAVAVSLLSSLAVAILWGSNITAIYPVVDVVMHNKCIPEYLDEKRAEAQARVDQLPAEIAVVEASLRTADPTDRKALQNKTSNLRDELRRKQQAISRYEKYNPLAHRYLPKTPFRTLMLLCAALVVGTLLKSIFRVIGAYYTAQLGNMLQFELRKEFFRRSLRLDLATFRETTTGDLLNRFVNNVGGAALGAMNVFGLAVREPMKIIVCLAGAAWVSWQLLLLTLISAPLAGYAIHWLAKSLKRANRKAIEELSTLYERLAETFDSIKIIKAFTRESRERARFHCVSKQFYKRTMRIALYDSLVSPITETMGLAIILAAVVAGGYLVLNQQTHLFGIRVSNEPLSHGMLTMFYFMLAGASDPVRRMTAVFNSLQQGAAAADHMYEVMDRVSRLAEPANPAALPACLGPIEFHDVSFAYKAAEPVLKGVTLRIEPGETIAIIGPNGCGKSTMVNLMLRFYDPTDGAITISGVDLRQLRTRELRDRIGIVTQETFLFDDTVAENIRFGRLSASFPEVIQASKRAHAHRFVTEVLANGYESKVGPGGNRLSGGQRQRISLARAILRNPDILILDEATSQIDVESERLIHDVLAEFTRDRTALIVTHRPSTLELADRIVVMDAGRIVDVGSYAELAGRCQLFQRLAHLGLSDAA